MALAGCTSVTHNIRTYNRDGHSATVTSQNCFHWCCLEMETDSSMSVYYCSFWMWYWLVSQGVGGRVQCMVLQHVWSAQRAPACSRCRQIRERFGTGVCRDAGGNWQRDAAHGAVDKSRPGGQKIRHWRLKRWFLLFPFAVKYRMTCCPCWSHCSLLAVIQVRYVRCSYMWSKTFAKILQMF